MKIEKEREVCFLMIDLYCARRHRQAACPQCRQLKSYVGSRLASCPYGDQKEFCSTCSVPCYRPDMQEQIRAVMRFSGPRMLIYHPVVALWHLVQTLGFRAGKGARG